MNAHRLYASMGDERARRWRVVDLGPEELILAGDGPRLSQGTALSLCLEADGQQVGPCDCTVESIGDEGMICTLGHLPFELAQMFLRFGRALQSQTAEPMGYREILDDPERIRVALRALVANKCDAFVRATGASRISFSIIAFDEETYDLVCSCPNAAELQPPFFIEVEGYNSMYWIPVLDVTRTEGEQRISFPRTIVRNRRRSGTRVVPKDLRLHFGSVRGMRERLIRDISRRGVSFWMASEDAPIVEGMLLRRVELSTGTTSVFFDARVRSVFAVDDQMACGLSVDLRTVSDLLAWSRLIDSAAHPTTWGGPRHGGDLWELFEASGYLNLSGRSSDDFEDRKRRFEAASAQLYSNPQIGCQIVFPGEGRLHATLSLLKTYTHSWLGFQMAKRPGRMLGEATRRQMLRDIHLHAYEYAMVDRDLRWFLGYVQEGTRFSTLVHHDFAARHASSGATAVVPFRAMQISTGFAQTFRRDNTIEVGRGSELDIICLSQHISKWAPQAYLESLDLVPERFSLDCLTAQWRLAGLSRERELFVARHGDRILAAAVVERATEGLHLYGLLESVRFYGVDADWKRAVNTLVGACADWYAARDINRFVVLRDGPDRDLLPGFVDLGPATITIVPIQMLGDLLEHVYEVTAPPISISSGDHHRNQ